MKQPLPQRKFRDDGRRLLGFADDILVTCPKCGGAGRVVPLVTEPAQSRPNVFSRRQLRCSKCLHRAEHRGTTVTLGSDACDPYFRLPLWLRTRTRHGTLFAYNRSHLDWIEAFVSARLRERRLSEGMASRSVASRLPLWVKIAGNRAEVLRAIARLRQRAASGP